MFENILKDIIDLQEGVSYAADDPSSHYLTYIGETEQRAEWRLVEEGPVCRRGCPASAAGTTGTWRATDHINMFNIELSKVTKL